MELPIELIATPTDALVTIPGMPAAQEILGYRLEPVWSKTEIEGKVNNIKQAVGTGEDSPMSARELLKVKHAEVIRKAKERGADELDLEEVRKDLVGQVSKKALKRVLRAERKGHERHYL